MAAADMPCAALMVRRMPSRRVPTFFLEGLMSSFPLGYLRTFRPSQTMPLSPLAVVVSKFTECLNGKERTPPFVALERTGVILNEKMTSAERATLIGLVEVTQRTEEFAQLRYLSGEEVAEVLSNTGGYYGRDRSGPIHSRGARRQSAPVNRCHFCRP